MSATVDGSRWTQIERAASADASAARPRRHRPRRDARARAASWQRPGLCLPTTRRRTVAARSTGAAADYQRHAASAPPRRRPRELPGARVPRRGAPRARPPDAHRALAPALHELAAPPAARGMRARAAPATRQRRNPNRCCPELRIAYHLPLRNVDGSATQTIALVDAYNDPDAEADLEVYDGAIELPMQPTATAASGKVDQSGASAEEGASGTPPKERTELQEREASCKSSERSGVRGSGRSRGLVGRDLHRRRRRPLPLPELPHPARRGRHVLLRRSRNGRGHRWRLGRHRGLQLLGRPRARASTAPPSTIPDRDHRRRRRRRLPQLDRAEEAKRPKRYYAGADYPASSPHVVAVGGTELTLRPAAHGRARPSGTRTRPRRRQRGRRRRRLQRIRRARMAARGPRLAAGRLRHRRRAKRAVADVAADADPYSGVAVYDSENRQGKNTLLMVHRRHQRRLPDHRLRRSRSPAAHMESNTPRRRSTHIWVHLLHDVTEGQRRVRRRSTRGCSGSMSRLRRSTAAKGALICNAAPRLRRPHRRRHPQRNRRLRALQRSRTEGPRSKSKRKNARKKTRPKKTAPKKAEEEASSQGKEAPKRPKKNASDRSKGTRGAEAKAENEPLKNGTRKERGSRTARTTEELKRALEEQGRSSKAGHGGRSARGRTRGRHERSGSSGCRPSARDAGQAAPATAPPRVSRTSSSRARERGDRARTAHHPRVAFAFTLSAPARAGHALAARPHGGRPRWVSAPGGLTLTAAAAATAPICGAAARSPRGATGSRWPLRTAPRGRSTFLLG